MIRSDLGPKDRFLVPGGSDDGSILAKGIVKIPQPNCTAILSALYKFVEMVSADTMFLETLASDNHGGGLASVDVAILSSTDNNLTTKLQPW